MVQKPLCGFFASKSLQPHPMKGDLFREQHLYERAPGLPAFDVHGAAQCHFHVGQLAVQHCGQPVCGPHQRIRHDGPLAGLPGAEPAQRHCHRFWHRHQCTGGPLPGCRGARKSRSDRHPRHGVFPAARHPRLGHCHCHHAVFPGALHNGCRSALHGPDLFPHRVWLCHGQHGLPGF